MWLIFAVLSSVFAALTSILAKVGIDNVNSNLATSIRTAVVLVRLTRAEHITVSLAAFYPLACVYFCKASALLQISRFAF